MDDPVADRFDPFRFEEARRAQPSDRADDSVTVVEHLRGLPKGSRVLGGELESPAGADPVHDSAGQPSLPARAQSTIATGACWASDGADHQHHRHHHRGHHQPFQGISPFVVQTSWIAASSHAQIVHWT